VYIPKPGKREKRPLGVPCVNDRALQRSTAQVLSAIYEADLYEGVGVKQDAVLLCAAMTAAL
jgi:retron-type reverse transcriptase